MKRHPEADALARKRPHGDHFNTWSSLSEGETLLVVVVVVVDAVVEEGWDADAEDVVVVVVEEDRRAVCSPKRGENRDEGADSPRTSSSLSSPLSSLSSLSSLSLCFLFLLADGSVDDCDDVELEEEESGDDALQASSTCQEDESRQSNAY